MIRVAFFSVCLLVVLSLGWGCDKEVEDEIDIPEGVIKSEELLQAETEFGLKFFAVLQEEYLDSNICFSPYSLYEALAMTANGANGNNLLEFLNVLELKNNCLESLNKLVYGNREHLLNADDKTLFSIANSFWYNREWLVYETFTNIIEMEYQAEVQGLNFSDPSSKDIINNWVEDQTQGRIRDLISTVNPSDLCFLVNAIYFNGSWTRVFDRERTRVDVFIQPDGYYSECNMMQVWGEFRVLHDDDMVLAELPYGDGSFAMYVMMPRKFDQKLDDFLANKIIPEWPGMIDSLLNITTRIRLPQFTIENDFLLNDLLKKKGLMEAFNPEADFSQMGEGSLWISFVKQKTFIDVNEDGTEAAAATAVGVTGSMPGAYEFIHPFVYIIADTGTGTPIFIGQVTNPVTKP